jgi:hypothetical protein
MVTLVTVLLVIRWRRRRRSGHCTTNQVIGVRHSPQINHALIAFLNVKADIIIGRYPK